MNRRTPAWRAASSMFSVAVGPLACDCRGSRTERGTLGIAASWKTYDGPLDRPPADLEVGDVALEPVVPPVEVGEVGAVPGGEVIDHAHAIALVQEGLDQVRADEAGPPRHHDPFRIVHRRVCPSDV